MFGLWHDECQLLEELEMGWLMKQAVRNMAWEPDHQL